MEGDGVSALIFPWPVHTHWGMTSASPLAAFPFSSSRRRQIPISTAGLLGRLQPNSNRRPRERGSTSHIAISTFSDCTVLFTGRSLLFVAVYSQSLQQRPWLECSCELSCKPVTKIAPSPPLPGQPQVPEQGRLLCEARKPRVIKTPCLSKITRRLHVGSFILQVESCISYFPFCVLNRSWKMRTRRSCEHAVCITENV